MYDPEDLTMGLRLLLTNAAEEGATTLEEAHEHIENLTPDEVQDVLLEDQKLLSTHEFINELGQLIKEHGPDHLIQEDDD